MNKFSILLLLNTLYFVRFCGSRAILSGPAGGVVGYAMTSYKDKPVVGFDMGGSLLLARIFFFMICLEQGV